MGWFSDRRDTAIFARSHVGRKDVYPLNFENHSPALDAVNTSTFSFNFAAEIIPQCQGKRSFDIVAFH